MNELDLLLERKSKLKDLRSNLLKSKDLEFDDLVEIVDTINCIIGRINCGITADDEKLEQMAIADKIRIIELGE